MTEEEKTCASLAEALALPVAELETVLQRGAAKMVKGHLTEKEISAIERLDLEGVFLLPMYPRYLYPARAAHIIGTVGEEETGEFKGQSGLEKQYDPFLQGRNTPEAAVLVDQSGRQTLQQLRLLPDTSPDTSHNVQLTLDLDYQEIAEQAFGDEVGALVVMEAATGDVLAMVSGPGFDPNQPQAETDGDVYVNKALYGYPPASVFKIVVAAAAIENGIELENFVCDGSYTLSNGHQVHCWEEEGHGPEDLASALANSCNPYFTKLGLTLGGDAILAYAKKFGLDQPELIGYQLPETWPALDFNTRVEGDIANASIGEKGVRLSPIQVASLLAVVANDGYAVTPRLVRQITDQKGNVVQEFSVQQPLRAIQASTAAQLRDYLKQVVDSGTGKRASSDIVTTGGKTGTSQYQGVWFAGMVSVEEPRWTIAIYLSEREAGGQEGALLFKEIAEKLAVLEGF